MTVAIGASLAVAARDEDQVGPVIGTKLLRVAAIAPQKQDSDILGRYGSWRGMRHGPSCQGQLLMVQAVRHIGPRFRLSSRLAGTDRRRHEDRDPGDQNRTRGAPPDRTRSGMPDIVYRDFSGHGNSPTVP